MGFLNQIMLFGMIGISIPILIHLLNRYRYRETDWAAMELLRRAMDVRSRRIRIEDLILLILRCLAVGLLAVSMARPTVRASGAKFFGGESRVGAVIALDGSYSMSYRPVASSRFDLALEKVRQITKTLRPGDEVSLVVMGQRPRILLRHASFDAEQFEEHLQKAAVLHERLNLELCLEQVAALMAEAKAPVRECYILSDSQELSWRQVSARARKSVLEIGDTGRAYYLSAATGSAENLALRNFAMTSGALRQGSVVRYVAEVTNFGRVAARNVPVTLQVGDQIADRRTVTAIQPGQTVPLPLYAKLKAPGNLRVTARLEHDALTIDDVRYAAARVHEQIRVLVVDGDPGRSLEESETFYLLKALVPNPAKASQASIRLKRVAYMELALQPLSDFAIVVLANVPDMRPAQAKALFNFVQHGGGLIVFLGDKVNPTVLNMRMRIGETSLLPGTVGKEVEVPPVRPRSPGAPVEAGWPIDAAGGDHPLARALERLPKQIVDEARITSVYRVEPHPQARVVLRVAGPDVPLLIAKPLGRGHVLLFASAADRDWGNLVINPAYLIFLHEAATYLTRQSHERQFAVARPLVIPLPRQPAAEQGFLIDPGGQSTPIQISGPTSERVADCGLPETPGFYRFRWGSPEPAAPAPIMVAVNVNPVESDVKTLSDDDLRASLGDLPVRLLAGDDLGDQVKQGRTGREIWRVLMVVGLVVLLVESLLAWYFSRKLGAEDSALPKTAHEEVLGESEAA